MAEDPAPRIEGLTSSYDLGAIVTGHVVVDRAEAVVVTLAFETSGECDPERAVLREVELGPGSGSLPFAIEGPQWPPTYVGELFSGHWYLEATAIRDGRRQASRQRLELGAEGHALAARPVRSPGAPTSGNRRRWRRLVVLVVLELACIAVIAVGLASGSALWAAGLVVGLVLLLPSIGTAQGILSHGAVGSHTVQVDQGEDGLAVHVRVGHGQAVESVAATLLVTEATQRGEGYDNPTRRRHDVHRLEVVLESVGSGRYGGTVPLRAPSPLPYTMNHSTAQVAWSLELRISLRGAPDITEPVALAVRPPAGGRSSTSTSSST